MLSIYLGILLISAATLAFEITLTRIFSVAQWYHFGFMAVSIALLGFGASGSILSAFPGLIRGRIRRRLSGIALLFSAGILASYLTINYLPFDSFRIAWERRQLLYLAVYYLSLTLPFLFSGLSIGALLSLMPQRASVIYAFNLAGSGLGCLAVLGILPLVGGAGAVLFATGLGLLAALAFRMQDTECKLQENVDRKSRITHHASRITHLAVLVLLAFLTLHPPVFLDVRMSPYKTLSTVLRYPDARLAFTRWNAFSRVDVVESGAIRSAPGLSFTYQGSLPLQVGLTVDGGNLSPITQDGEADEADFLDDLPTALPYYLRPQSRVLIVQPRGGLDVLQALHHDVASVTVVEDNPLVVEAVRDRYDVFTGRLYHDPRVRIVLESGRSYARRTGERFDLIYLSLSDTFKVVNFGAYSLTEETRYTVEAFQDFYRRLADGGLLVVSRWLQIPPSESVRAGAVAVEALRGLGVARPEEQIVAFRSFQTMTILIKRGPFTQAERQTIRAFCRERQFDLVYLPGIAPDEVNRYNVLDEPAYHQAFQQILSAQSGRFFAEYPYDVSPPTDDKPFFFHFFKWSQVPLILRLFGKTWQPFGGGGYLVLVALLILTALASAGLILLPLGIKGTERTGGKRKEGSRLLRLRIFGYFTLLGIGYLFIEIPLMQRFILFLGHPTYAFAAVLFAVLVFSGLGSLASPRLPLPWVLAALCVAILLYPPLLPPFFRLLLGLPLTLRLLAAILILAPLGFLMGMPFPKGIALLSDVASDLIPWAWGVNGCASVLSSILSVMIAVASGFSWVLVGASVAYGVALVAIYPLTE